ncbi:CHAP domain-containing protein [Terrabacter sp. Soil810]|uniref:CHAP domain-containing protein n=1 Tax=Terrabacter sp. Soil810 TaxID=1736418 RepID=UPI000709A79C|nr:CHAP domain-containing protein [Terrabacter sp. Soil810]KRF38081.1 chap protein [Terrabacter sp. Soil810]
MNTEIIRGRHRAPGRHNPLNELKLLARESAQPAMKAGAVVAATGGLVATFANPASADTLSPSSGDVAAAAGVDAAAPAAVGPATAAAPAASTALSKIGYAPAAQQAVAKRVAKPKPQVIEDVQVKTERAAAKAAAERKATAQRASRDLTRSTLTNSTSSTKSSSNGSVPSASSGMRASSNWATDGQCTWGALNKWYQSEGYYPGGWTGNAMVWDTGAANAGYTVSGTPRTRSILVMEPGVHGSSSVGHVAWVTAVNGNEVTIVEMNALAGAYNYNTRTLTDGPGMRYIYAP